MHAFARILQRARTVSALALLFLAAGCASYKLGAPGEQPFTSVFIPPVENRSFAPQAQAALTSELRQRLIRDGRVRVVADKSGADAILRVTLVEYRRETGARDSEDTILARDFDVTLVARTSLYDARNGKYVYRDRVVEDRSNVFAENPFAGEDAPRTQGFLQSEYQAMPRIARDLARKIANQALGAW